MRRLLLLAIFSPVLFPGVASAKLALKGKPSAQFDAVGPGGLKIEGKAKDAALADDGTAITFTVKVNDVDTGIALRNKHMREKYVNSKEHPDVTLEVPRASIPFPAKGEDKRGTVKGVFTLKGKPKDVVVGYTAKNDDGVLEVAGSFDIDVREHDISIPNYLGVTVDPKMTIRMDFKATDDAP